LLHEPGGVNVAYDYNRRAQTQLPANGPAAVDGAIRLLDASRTSAALGNADNRIYRVLEHHSVEQVSWWRRRESVCHDLQILGDSRRSLSPRITMARTTSRRAGAVTTF